jgi:hypothetical protein
MILQDKYYCEKCGKQNRHILFCKWCEPCHINYLKDKVHYITIMIKKN